MWTRTCRDTLTRVGHPLFQHIHRIVDLSLRRREVRTEGVINYVRIAVYAAGIALEVFTAARTLILGARYEALLAGLVTIIVFYLSGVHVFTNPERYRPWLKYVTISVDFSIPAG